MSARRGPHLVPIEIPTTFAAKKRQENIVYKELKHLHDGIFRVIVLESGSSKLFFLTC